jgi:predicted DNA binding CopG/RHH family protein
MVSMRFDHDLIATLKKAAGELGLPYQAIAKTAIRLGLAKIIERRSRTSKR